MSFLLPFPYSLIDHDRQKISTERIWDPKSLQKMKALFLKILEYECVSEYKGVRKNIFAYGSQYLKKTW